MAGHRISKLWIGLWTALNLAACGSDGGPGPAALVDVQVGQIAQHKALVP
jgi:hypothetical protein